MRSETVTVTWKQIDGKKAMEFPDGRIAIQDEKDPVLFIDNSGNKYRIDLSGKNTEKFVSDYKGLSEEDQVEIYNELKDLDNQVNRCMESTSANTWDLLRSKKESFRGEISCDFCHSSKTVEYLDVAGNKVDWFIAGQFMQQLLDMKIHFVCSECSVKLQNEFRKCVKSFVENGRRKGFAGRFSTGLTAEERTALMTDFFGS